MTGEYAKKTFNLTRDNQTYTYTFSYPIKPKHIKGSGTLTQKDWATGSGDNQAFVRIEINYEYSGWQTVYYEQKYIAKDGSWNWSTDNELTINELATQWRITKSSRSSASGDSQTIYISEWYEKKGGWIEKTGSLYTMTSNTTPSPFVASGTQSTSFSKYGSPWQAFDGDDSNGYGADLFDNGSYVEAIIKFNLSKSIRIKKLYYSFYCASSGSNTRQIWLQIDGSWVSVQNVTVSGATSGTIDIGSGQYANSIVTGIKARCTSLPSRDTYIKEIKVTEWYEKEN